MFTADFDAANNPECVDTDSNDTNTQDINTQDTNNQSSVSTAIKRHTSPDNQTHAPNSKKAKKSEFRQSATTTETAGDAEKISINFFVNDIHPLQALDLMSGWAKSMQNNISMGGNAGEDFTYLTRLIAFGQRIKLYHPDQDACIEKLMQMRDEIKHGYPAENADFKTELNQQINVMINMLENAQNAPVLTLANVRQPLDKQLELTLDALEANNFLLAKNHLQILKNMVRNAHGWPEYIVNTQQHRDLFESIKRLSNVICGDLPAAIPDKKRANKKQASDPAIDAEEEKFWNIYESADEVNGLIGLLGWHPLEQATPNLQNQNLLEAEDLPGDTGSQSIDSANSETENLSNEEFFEYILNILKKTDFKNLNKELIKNLLGTSSDSCMTLAREMKDPEIQNAMRLLCKNVHAPTDLSSINIVGDSEAKRIIRAIVAYQNSDLEKLKPRPFAKPTMAAINLKEKHPMSSLVLKLIYHMPNGKIYSRKDGKYLAAAKNAAEEIVAETGSYEMTVRQIIEKMPKSRDYKNDGCIDILKSYPHFFHREDLTKSSMKMDTKLTYLTVPDKYIMRVKNDDKLFKEIIKRAFGYRPFTRRQFYEALGGVAELLKQRLMSRFLFTYDNTTHTFTLIPDSEIAKRTLDYTQKRKERVIATWINKGHRPQEADQGN
jgi:hypothetical protein